MERVKKELEERKKRIQEQIKINNIAIERALSEEEGCSACLENCTSPVSKRQRALSLSKCMFNINSALARLETGTYGSCQDCGRAIGERRLLAEPEARRCIHCQEVSI